MNLTFDPVSHTYRLDGVEIPSVTTVLDWAGFSPPYPATGDYKARGTAVHTACLYYDQGKRFRVDPRIDGYLASYEIFRKDFPMKWDLMEIQAFHPVLVYAGTLDRGYLGRHRGNMLIVDIKTGEPPKKRLGLQTAAYAMLHANPPRSAERMGVQLDKDGGRYKLHECSDPADFDVWVGLVHRWHWERKR
jgi:hypothetical protein